MIGNIFKIKGSLLVLSLMILTMMVSCKKDKTTEEETVKKVGVNLTLFNVKYVKDTIAFKVYSHVPWTITNLNEDWCKALTLSGDTITIVKVAIAYNPLMKERKGEIKVTFDLPEEQTEETVTFKQAPEPPMLIPSQDTIIVSDAGGIQTINVSSNIPFDIINIDDYDWIDRVSTYAMTDEGVSLSFKPNRDVNYRIARLKLKQRDTTTVAVVNVFQMGIGNLDSDKKTLTALYNALDGANWTNKWDLSQPVEKWYGVTVEETPLSGKRVTEVRLSDNNLSGVLPSDITELDYLKILWLDNNNISGEIPADIAGRCTYLVYLYLHNNSLTGVIPSNIGTLEYMNRLYLLDNKLEGEIPESIGLMSDLNALGLSNNNLTGGLPVSIGKLKGLKFVFVNGNRLSGTVPETYINNINWIDWLPAVNIFPQQDGYILK